MAFAHALPLFTHEEYLRFERYAEEKHEYLDGLVYAMAGASPTHNLICASITEIITRQLRGTGCYPFTSDMKTRCIPLPAGSQSREGLFAYPDFIVACGEPRYHDEKRDVLLNPKLIVEVLSQSTANYDRGEKFQRYQQLDSLTDYLLIAQDRPCVEHFSKQLDGQWVHTVETDLAGSILIVSINCRIPLAEVYEWVRFSDISSD